MTASLTSLLLSHSLLLSLSGLSSIFSATSLPSLVAFTKHNSATFFKRFFFVVVVATSISIPFRKGQYIAVIANVCNPGLIDPAEKVSPLMLDLYLRAERAMGATQQHFGL